MFSFFFSSVHFLIHSSRTFSLKSVSFSSKSIGIGSWAGTRVEQWSKIGGKFLWTVRQKRGGDWRWSWRLLIKVRMQRLTLNMLAFLSCPCWSEIQSRRSPVVEYTSSSCLSIGTRKTKLLWTKKEREWMLLGCWTWLMLKNLCCFSWLAEEKLARRLLLMV